MTRTAKSPRLTSHIAEPYCEIHPRDAAQYAIAPASLVVVESRHGAAILRALVTERQRPGSVFAPMHWTDQFAAKGRIDAVVDGATDPISGQPGLKATAVCVRPFAAAWHGFAVVSRKPERIEAEYWALARVAGGWRIELAGTAEPDDWQAFAGALLGATDAHETLAYHDAARGARRFAVLSGERLGGALFVAREPVEVSRAWASERLAAPLDAAARLRLLSGRAGPDQGDPGAIVCACLNVGVNDIAAAIRAGATGIAAVGAATGAGTNCGSCRIEIGRLIDAHSVKKAG